MRKLMEHEYPQRFMDKVMQITETGCWIWMGAYTNKGYGKFCVSHTKTIQAHRFSYELHKGPIPAGHLICHKCDVPACVNPVHLFAGTSQDNEDDKRKKKRHLFGTRHHQHKLTEMQVFEIRNSKENGPALSRRYGVSHGVIYRIKSRQIWKHLGIPESSITEATNE